MFFPKIRPHLERMEWLSVWFIIDKRAKHEIILRWEGGGCAYEVRWCVWAAGDGGGCQKISWWWGGGGGGGSKYVLDYFSAGNTIRRLVFWSLEDGWGARGTCPSPDLHPEATAIVAVKTNNSYLTIRQSINQSNFHLKKSIAFFFQIGNLLTLQ